MVFSCMWFQWKIRYTLASSLHEIARVIGPELAERDLVPFFNALVKDVDEVRVGILKNLASFIKVSTPASLLIAQTFNYNDLALNNACLHSQILGTVERRKCLESLRSFLDTDNERNWRFRLEVLHQLEQLTELYEADEIYKYLRPLAVDLVKDGVAEVRKTALSVVSLSVTFPLPSHCMRAIRLKCVQHPFLWQKNFHKVDPLVFRSLI